MSRVLAVIPARYDSTRFPGKPLAVIGGKEMILRVAERAAKCKMVGETIVATDDERIRKVVEGAGFRAAMTSKSHASGTDRVAEVAKNSDAKIIVNIQGDEPLMDAPSVDRAIEALLADESLSASTLAIQSGDAEAYRNPNVVKVVFDNSGYAMYFSRSPIPHYRDGGHGVTFYKHIGLYAYRRDFLIKLADMAQTTLEKAEMLEQLRILQNGARIRIVMTDKDSVGIDTPEDLKRAEAFFGA